MLAKLLEIISKFRAGDLRGAFKIILEILLDNIDQVQLPTLAASSAHATKSETDLVDELDSLCVVANFTAQVGWFDKVKPILMELLRRWLGF